MVKKPEIVQTNQDQAVSMFGFSAARISKPGIFASCWQPTTAIPRRNTETLQKCWSGIRRIWSM
jgi:hypothetical protein